MFRRFAVTIPLLLCLLLGVQCTSHRHRPTKPTGAPDTSLSPATKAPSTTRAPATTKADRPAPAGPTTVAPPTNRPIWRPAPRSALQIQLSGAVDLSADAPVYEIDGEHNDASVVAALHARGRKVICYFDAGAAETYRSDHADIPASVLGQTVSGWPDERWLDIRQIQALTPVIARRIDMCRAKGFDAVDPDMLEAYAANSGFPLTAQDQLTYNRWIAKLAHDRGLAVAMKGNVDQIAQLAPHFDFAINEQCAEYNECQRYQPFLAAGKAVFQIEYDLPLSEFCAKAKELGIHAQRKHLSLDAWSQPC
jgi:hypothetical protein